MGPTPDFGPFGLFKNFRLHARFKIFLIILMLSFGLSVPVLALATIGNVSGPSHLDPGYTFTAEVTELSPPDGTVCLKYRVNGGATNTVNCSCTAPGCNPISGTGTWSCAIPLDYNNATIAWDISGWSGNCGSKKTQGPTGSFDTGPTAITLNNTSSQTQAIIPDPAILVGTGLLVLGILLFYFYLRRQSYSGSQTKT